MIGGVALVVPVLAGCEAGNIQYHQAADGAYASADAVTISNAFILGGPDNKPLAKGSSASMFLSVYNGGQNADKLIGIDATGTASSVQLAGGSIAIPAQNLADLEGPKPKVVLRGLSKALSSGQTVNVLLTFQNAGSVDLTVPIEARTTYYSTYSPPPPAPSATKHVSAGATRTATPTVTPTVTPTTSAPATATPTPTPTP
jgi:copper(I)-binding protein